MSEVCIWGWLLGGALVGWVAGYFLAWVFG